MLICFKSFLDYLQLESFDAKSIDVESACPGYIYTGVSCFGNACIKATSIGGAGSIFHRIACAKSVYTRNTCTKDICARSICIKNIFVKAACAKHTCARDASAITYSGMHLQFFQISKVKLFGTG